MTPASHNRPGAGIAFVLVAMLCISLNDLIIKALSGGYPLHQMVFLRSGIGVVFSLVLVQMEGGVGILRTRYPWWQLARGLLIVVSNLTYFAALAAIPLADASALFFVAPLFITLLSIPLLGEKVGPLRIGAVVAGLVGVVIMQRPWEDAGTLEVPRIILLLPVVSALTYALNQILTCRLGAETKASALAVYVQATFIVVSLGFYFVAGDGRFAEGLKNESLVFLLRAWVWPDTGDWWVFLALGLNSAAIGYCLSQAYRLATAATIAPYEYSELMMAVFWGWLVFSEVPDWEVWTGIVLILASGLFVFLREQQKSRAVARAAGVKARY